MLEEGKVGKLAVDWDGQHTVGVSLSPDFASQVEGLCGDYNGNSNKVDENGNEIGDEIDLEKDIAVSYSIL